MQEYNLLSKAAIEQRASTGWLLKWNIGDKWVKSPGFNGNFVGDSYSEIISYAVARDLGIKNILCYKPCILTIDNCNRVLADVSVDFRHNRYTEVTMLKMKDAGSISGYTFGIEGYLKLIQDIKRVCDLDITTYLEDMIALDYVLCNDDRNLWNISVLYDNIEHSWVLCPIYDNGNSLGLAGYNTLDIGDTFDMDLFYGSGKQAKPFDCYFENQLTYIRDISRYQHKKLDRTAKVINNISKNFLVTNNTYNVLNALEKEQLNFVIEGIKFRMNYINSL